MVNMAGIKMERIVRIVRRGLSLTLSLSIHDD